MSVYRIRKDRNNPYVMINKTFVHDERLSYKAKGILLYLLSRPDDWQVYEIEIMKHAKDGRDSVRGGIKELIEAGYIDRAQKRDENGKFVGYNYDVFEVPTEDGKSDNGKPDIGESNTTKYRNKLSNEVTNIYINLPVDDHNIFLRIYDYLFAEFLGSEHPKVTPKQLEYIQDSIATLQELGVDDEEWHREVVSHFKNLPETNNGNILAFLKAAKRYFDVDLEAVK